MERGRGNKEQPTYLEPNKQLLIAAKVNRICAAGAEDFDEQLIEDAQEVVYALASRIKPSSATRLYGELNTPGTSIKGETDRGEFSFSNGENKKSFMLIGRVDEYRIGSYIAQKFAKGKLSELWFKDFFGAGGADMALENYKPATQITYQQEDLSLVSIERANPKVARLGFIKITRYDYVSLWKKDK